MHPLWRSALRGNRCGTRLSAISAPPTGARCTPSGENAPLFAPPRLARDATCCCIKSASLGFLNMEKLIQCKNGPEPLKSKGLRDLSQFSAVVLIVEKGWISWRSRQMGAYQHTKPNGHTIPGMNRVAVQWERVIVYQESCDSRLLQSKRPFFGPFWPDVPPDGAWLDSRARQRVEGEQWRTCGQAILHPDNGG